MTVVPDHPRIVELETQRQRALDASNAASSVGFAADHGWADPAESAQLDVDLLMERARLKEVTEGVRRDHPALFEAWVSRELAAAEQKGDRELMEHWRAVQSGERDDVVFGRF